MIKQYFGSAQTNIIAYAVIIVLAIGYLFTLSQQIPQAPDYQSSAVKVDSDAMYLLDIPAIDNLSIQATLASTSVSPVTQAVSSSGYIQRTKVLTQNYTIEAEYCKRLNWSLMNLAPLSMKFPQRCVSTVQTTYQWYVARDDGGYCPAPNKPGVIKTEVWMLAWKVTVTAIYLTEATCKRVQWLSVDCKVDYAFGWDIKIDRCEATDKTPAFYQWTTFTAQWRAIFLHEAIGVIQFGHCLRSGADPRLTDSIYNFRRC